MNSTEEFYRSEIKKAIKREISMGNDDLANIITSLGGADPRIVIEIYNEVIDNGIDIPNSEEFDRDIQATRSFIAHALFDFPAPDPMRSQWWFSLDTIEELAIRIYKLCDSKDASFLGSPTVGLFYSHCFKTPAVLLDIDSDILTSVTALTNVDVYQYDVADELPEELINKFQVILIDPPWYPSILEAFLYRANELIEPEGYILCTLPSLFTRPDVTKERLILLGGLLKSNFEVVSIESNLVRYEAPEFEIAAYKDISELINHKWRCGDLLILRTTQNSNLSFPTRIPKLHVESYARDPQKTRFFLCTDRIVDEQKETIKVIDSFESNVSVRAIPIDQVTVWGTNKKGVSLNDITIGQAILNAWKQGKNPEETTEELVKLGYKNPDTNVQDFNKYLELWEDFDKTALRRGPKELENKRNEYVSEFASKPSSRMYEFTPDGFRVDFQRDRDRVLWSHSLKRLANKTQLFPVQKGDQLRRRLVHSIEVMQLASTISSSFGLDRDLTEACALAHDIGHLPFGHGGEYALNSALNEISEAFGGFNHYEHGVDVVRWLENVYQQPGAGGFPGLNLTFETVEGIFKHCYHMGGDHELGQRTLSRKTKHPDLREDTFCHLEGQAVRIADKISYLISDLEDGIRMGLISYNDLCSCRLFDRSPIDIRPAKGESLYDRFISQRRAILKVIMEDILTSTDIRLLEHNNIESIRKSDEYTVNYSQALEHEINEIWRKLQSGKLHSAPAVKAKNDEAARIITGLLIKYSIFPHFVENIFRESHQRLRNTEYFRWYVGKVGNEIGIPKRLVLWHAYGASLSSNLKSQGDNWMIPTENLIQAKDYIASLSDRKALQEYQKYLI